MPTADDGIEGRVCALITRTFGLPPNQSANDLRMGAVPGWDSMGHMNLIVELENEFGVSFPTPQIAELVDVPSICRGVVEGRAA